MHLLDRRPSAAAVSSNAFAPIGVFDSGIGGLSILRELKQQLPDEHWVYLADTGYAPYGEKTESFVLERTLAVAEHLRDRYAIKALVVACNTATAAAIAELRERFPNWPIVGVEPALKPAVAHTKTGHIGVMATRQTVNSQKFRRLLASLPEQCTFAVQACDGLAKAIDHHDTIETAALIQKYTSAMGEFGSQSHQIDTVVLGCTHYGLANDVLKNTLGTHVTLLDPADGVARRLKHQLTEKGLLCQAPNPLSSDAANALVWMSTGDPSLLAHAIDVHRFLPANAKSSLSKIIASIA